MHVLLRTAPSGRFAAMLGAAVVALAGEARADISCLFDLECLEGEACAKTDFSLEINGTGDGARLETEAETVDGALRGGDGRPPYFTGATPSATHLLTVGPAPGTSRYTVHLPDVPMGAHYSGTCEETS